MEQRFTVEDRYDYEKAQDYIEQVLTSPIRPNEKIEKLSVNPYNGVNIVEYMLAFGKSIDYLFTPEKVEDGNGDDFFDFFNEFHYGLNFSTIEELIKDERDNIDKDLLNKCEQAIFRYRTLYDLFDIKNNIPDIREENLEEDDIDDEEVYNDVRTLFSKAVDFLLETGKYEYAHNKTMYKQFIQRQSGVFFVKIGEMVGAELQSKVEKFIDEQTEKAIDSINNSIDNKPKKVENNKEVKKEKSIGDKFFETFSLGWEKDDSQKHSIRAEFFIRATLTLKEKLKELSFNPYSRINIVEYIIEKGRNIEYLFMPELLFDSHGNNFQDFVETKNIAYFSTAEELLDKAKDEKIAGRRTRILIEKWTKAVVMWNWLKNLYSKVPTNSNNINYEKVVEFCDVAIEYINICAILLFKKNKSAQKKYITIQTEKLFCFLSEKLLPYQNVMLQNRYKVVESKKKIYNKALEIVKKEKYVSCALLQLKLSIAYEQAFSILDKMEKEGVLSARNDKTLKWEVIETK